MIDWSVNLGNIATILSLLGAAVFAVATLRGRVDAVSRRLAGLEEKMEKLVEILVAQGRQDERMNGIDSRIMAQGSRIDDLKRQMDRFFDVKGGKA